MRGDPKSQNSMEMRYDGGLIVSLKEKGQGLWYDFSESVGSSPIQAIMKSEGLPFSESLTRASALRGYIPLEPLELVVKKQILFLDKERNNKIFSAKSIWNSGTLIQGTLAERYLKKYRGIESVKNMDARFWPVGTSWSNYNENGELEQKTNQIPALLFVARNENGELTAVHRIYLDAKTAKKNTFLENAKLSKGIIEGSAGLIQKGMQGSRLYIAEGPETAVSIAMVIQSSAIPSFLIA